MTAIAPPRAVAGRWCCSVCHDLPHGYSMHISLAPPLVIQVPTY
jgi:hypothetical protein